MDLEDVIMYANTIMSLLIFVLIVLWIFSYGSKCKKCPSCSSPEETFEPVIASRSYPSSSRSLPEFYRRHY